MKLKGNKINNLRSCWWRQQCLWKSCQGEHRRHVWWCLWRLCSSCPRCSGGLTGVPPPSRSPVPITAAILSHPLLVFNSIQFNSIGVWEPRQKPLSSSSCLLISLSAQERNLGWVDDDYMGRSGRVFIPLGLNNSVFLIPSSNVWNRVWVKLLSLKIIAYALDSDRYGTGHWIHYFRVLKNPIFGYFANIN